jgi:hypothetical protein
MGGGVELSANKVPALAVGSIVPEFGAIAIGSLDAKGCVISVLLDGADAATDEVDGPEADSPLPFMNE